MEAQPLKIISTVDAVYHTLADEIFAMRFPPGSKITESVLSERYGVSRNTLREAIAMLLSHGLLVKIPNKGVYVQTIDVDDMKEIFRLRGMLEREAITRIMERGFVPEELFVLADRINEVDAHANDAEYIRADVTFHRELVASAGSPRLLRLYSAIFAEVKLCIYRAHSVSPVNHGNAITHRLLLEAMEKHDLSGALVLLRQHMDHAVETYANSFRLLDSLDAGADRKE